MAPSRIYQKCEEPEQTIIGDMGTQRDANFLSKYWKYASGRTSVLVLYILNGLSFFLWIIILSALASKYSEMARELEQLRSNQTVLRTNGNNMKKQLDAIHIKNSGYESKLNESQKKLESNTYMLKQMDKELGNLQTEGRKLLDTTFRLTYALYKVNASACQVCPEGWLLNNGQCYHFQTMSKHWSFAKKSCEDEGGHLVIINDAEEQKFLTSQMKSKSYWIGLHDMVSENNFVWVDGTPLSYKNWEYRQPDNYGHGEDCVEIRSGGYWNDLECGDESLDGWICEKPWKC